LTDPLAQVFGRAVASLPEEKRRELADYLRSELAPVYRMFVTTDVYWTRLGP
jgi:hypothetical protein